MQIICISRGTLAGGGKLAANLAAKLGCECVSREELSEAATLSGIPVGRLELAVVRSRPLTEQMALEKERFKAFMTAGICERALEKGGLVYHGRTGHLVLPGATHVMRVRTIMDDEGRIALTMQRLGLSRAKAMRYNEQVDEDRRRWVSTIYNIDWRDAAHYDFVVNLSHLNVNNAAAALLGMAALPEFQVTPASRRVIEDLLLAARCRLAIGAHPRTRPVDAQVKAKRGTVSITYPPRHASLAAAIPEVIESIPGINEIVCTIASTNLLWIQGRFDPRSTSLSQVLEIAGRWDAAVEMVQLLEKVPGTPDVSSTPAPDPSIPSAPAVEPPPYNGGILDDDLPDAGPEDDDVRRTVDRMISSGRAGGYRLVRGEPKDLLNSLDRTTSYSLVVVGDVFLTKGTSLRKRLSRDLVAYLSDHLRVPVIEAEDLKARYLFGPQHWVKLLGLGALVIPMLLFIFTYQKAILEFLSRPGTTHRALSTICLLAFVAVFAYLYGNFARYLLRLFRFE